MRAAQRHMIVFCKPIGLGKPSGWMQSSEQMSNNDTVRPLRPRNPDQTLTSTKVTFNGRFQSVLFSFFSSPYVYKFGIQNSLQPCSLSYLRTDLTLLHAIV